MESDGGGKDSQGVSIEDGIDRFAKCEFTHCLTLENGILGKCSRATHAQYIQNFEARKEDYIDVYSENLRDNIVYYIENCNSENNFYMEACRYCTGSYYGKPVKPAIQI